MLFWIKFAFIMLLIQYIYYSKEQENVSRFYYQDILFMKKQGILSTLSHYEYQSKQAISRLGQESTSNQHLSFIPKLNNASVAFLEKCLQNEKNILLSHVSPLGQNEDELKAGLDGIKVLKGDKLIAYFLNVDENKDQTIFVDLFNIAELVYKPFLIKILDIFSKSKLKNVKKQFILYYHKSEQKSIKEVVHEFTCQVNEQLEIESCFVEVELSVPTLFQYIVVEDLFETLQIFLGDQAKQTQKRDVLIFKSIDEQFKKKMFYLTKTRGFHISTTLIYEDSQNLAMNPAATNIVVVSNTSSLRALSNVIDFSRFYLILDFEEDVYKYFDYQRCCYVQVRDKISYSQKCNRTSFGLGNLGEYVCLGQAQGKIEIIDQKEQRIYQDYGTYCLRMTQLGLGWWLDKQQKSNDQIRFCNEALKNLQMIKENKLNVLDNIVDLCAEGINPIICNSVLAKQKEKNLKLKHLLALTEAILCCPDIRTQFNSQANVMPSSIWHKNGYLQSCLDIIIKCIFVEKSSQNTLITIEDILSDFQVSKDKFSTVLRHYHKLCKLLKIQPAQLGSGLQEEDYVQLIEELITIFKPAFAIFSGSRRLGYLFKGLQTGFLVHKKSLMSFYNEKPNFILVTKLLIDRETQKPFIFTCNYVRDDILIKTYGCLPTLSKQSFGQCEVQFHKISSAVFAHLSKYDGLQMTIFENENQCSVEANSELNAITIQCSKERQKQISEKFAKVLADIQDMFKKETKSFMQTKNLKVVLRNGAEVMELMLIEKDIKKQVSQMALLKNLAPEVGIEELKQLFDEFIQLRDIKIVPKQTGNEAIISFYSMQDYKRFYQIFSGCVYYDHSMIIQPYVDEKRAIQEEECLLFQWNVCKSTGEALIEFQTPEAARNALTNFKNLAGPKVIVEVKANMIFAERLDQNVDEKDIAAWVSGHGKISNVQIRRYHANKEANEQVSIRNIVKRAFPKQQVVCHPDKIVKGKNGYRSCKIAVPNKQTMNQIFFILNQVRGVLGNGKLYVSPLFSWSLKLPEPDQTYANVYLDIIEDLSKQLNRVEPLKTELFKQPLAWTLVIQSDSEQQMKIIKSFLPERIKGTVLNVKQSELLFTEIAQKNFEKLQKKLPIKIVPDIISKKIKVLCRPSLHQIIEKQINTQIEESFNYKLPLYQKAFAYLQLKIAEILNQQVKCGLKYFFEPINKSLNLEGNLMILERARQKINKSLAILKSKAQEDNLGNEDICGLCCQQFKHSFKLQGCDHVFCFDCLQSSVKYSLQDINLYPLKCPQCAQKIWISDLSCLLPQKQWKNILKNSVNQFVYCHPGQFMFCLTVGCSYICDVKFKQSYSCPQCKKGYCLQCNNQIHPGMTCHEARYGSDRLFNEYMSNIGGRVCANKACKAPIERISGCFKVQCSRCKKCMCFKCPANQMVVYDTPEQTYNHLKQFHGGCF